MNIAIAGGTGFVGKALTELLLAEGHKVFILTRRKVDNKESADVQYLQWLTDDNTAVNYSMDNGTVQTLPTFDALVNLAGESINGKWTEERKQRILDSRIAATNQVIKLIRSLQVKPKVLVNASAIGFYGTSLDATYTEESMTSGDDFLANVVKRWEQEASKAEELGVRVVCTRFGLILGNDGGAFSKLTMPYKLGAGGPLGKGNQWYSWVHIDDVVKLIYFAITNAAINGALNVTSPYPVTMNEFGKTLASVLHRPHWLPAPSFLLKFVLGEMSILVLEGQRVLPEKALKHGYEFKYSYVKDAINDLI